MNKRKILNKIVERRKNRTRSQIRGTASKPRLSIFRSNKESYVQLIDDEAMKTMIGASTKEIRKSAKEKETKLNLAAGLGELVAKKAKEAGIQKVIFDRGSYKYHGRVKAVAEGARKGGLEF